MTGWEQLVAWMFGIVMAAATFMAAAKTRADSRVEVARAQLDALRAWLEAQFGAPLHVPADWSKDGDR